MKFHIGCSGFSYKEWKGIFYPDGLPTRSWLEFYARHFNTLEINSSFYRLPSERSIENWYQQTPEKFLFSVKASKFITHIKRFNVKKEIITDFYKLFKNGLKEKLGCVLFQMPPSFHYSEEHLKLITEKLDPEFRNVVEFRHKSWWTDEVYKALSATGIIFCGQSFPGDIPEEAIQNNAVVYYRFHGKPVLYKSEYDPSVLKKVLDQVKKNRKDVFIYFNNTWGESALINARQIIEMVNDVKKD